MCICMCAHIFLYNPVIAFIRVDLIRRLNGEVFTGRMPFLTSMWSSRQIFPLCSLIDKHLLLPRISFCQSASSRSSPDEHNLNKILLQVLDTLKCQVGLITTLRSRKSKISSKFQSVFPRLSVNMSKAMGWVPHYTKPNVDCFILACAMYKHCNCGL